MNEKLERAKKLFFGYSCNKFYMSRDGKDIELMEMGVTEEQEGKWRKEYIDYWVARLSIDDLEAVHKLNHAWAVEAMPDLLIMCNQAEGYAKLWYANTIWNLVIGVSLQGDIRQQSIKTSIEAWKSLVAGKFNIPEHFRKKIVSNMPPIETTTAENYIINYAKRKLEEAKKNLGAV